MLRRRRYISQQLEDIGIYRNLVKQLNIMHVQAHALGRE